MNALTSYFEQVPDRRGHSNAQRHLLLDLLTIALCAMLAGGRIAASNFCVTGFCANARQRA